MRGLIALGVVAACGGAVGSHQIAALVGDLTDQLEEDGLDRRIEVMTGVVTRKDHAQEVLRIAGLVALSSEDVSPVERSTLEKLATRWGLDEGAVDAALSDVRGALAEAAQAKA